MFDDILNQARKRLRRTRPYHVWREFRRFQQLKAFNEVLDCHLGDLSGDAASYNERLTKSRLANLEHDRREFIVDSGCPRIAAFGAMGWEQYGLWPSFERVAHFELSNYGREFALEPLPDEPNAEWRQKLGNGFLKFIDDFEQREGFVTCAFFYASGKHISDGILSELARRGIWTIIMSLDDKQMFFAHGAEPSDQLRVATRCDLYWTTWRTGTQIVLNRGGNPWYAPEGADPVFHRPLEVERDIDIVFVGQCYGMRMKLMRYLRERGLKVETWGSGWPNGFASFDKTVELFSRAKFVLGVGGVGMMVEISHLKGRDFEVPMCGALYLTSFNPELADHYKIGHEIFCYSSFEECADTAHWLLRQPQLAQTAREDVLARCLKEHTWEQRITDLFELFPK
jgi:hypothetical protein